MQHLGAHVARDEEGTERAFGMRQVSGIAHHFVGERLLGLAHDQFVAWSADREREGQVGELPTLHRVGIEALVFAAQLVADLVAPPNGAQQREPGTANLPLAALLADLGQAVVVLFEIGVILEQGHAGTDGEKRILRPRLGSELRSDLGQDVLDVAGRRMLIAIVLADRFTGRFRGLGKRTVRPKCCSEQRG